MEKKKKKEEGVELLYLSSFPKAYFACLGEGDEVVNNLANILKGD